MAVAHDEDRARRLPQHPERHAPEQRARNGAVTARSDDDEVDASLVAVRHDLVGSGATQERRRGNDTLCGREFDPRSSRA